MAGTLANIKVEPMVVTFAGVDVGFTEGDVSVKSDEAVVEIKAHQYSAQMLDEIRIGKSCEISMNLQEISTSQLTTLLNFAGQAYTPSGGTAVSGYGTDDLRTSRAADGIEIVLKPVGAANNLRNLTFFLAYPVVGEIKYSGEKPVSVPVTAKCYPKLTNNGKVQLWAFGDGTQSFV
jgi:hypothetical protein